MILELVSTLTKREDLHALYLPGSWPQEAANGRRAVCGATSDGGWELHSSGEPTCSACLILLRGDALHIPLGMLL